MTFRRLPDLPGRDARRIRADVDDEIAFHVDARAQELIAAGATEEDARRRAAAEFGDVDDARRYMNAIDARAASVRERREWWSDFVQDVGYALRKLRATPAFTLAAVTTLALAIGANTAIYSVVDGVLLRPLPFHAPDRLLQLRVVHANESYGAAPPDLVDYRSRSTLFEGFGAVEPASFTLLIEGTDPERITGARVSVNWFDLLRVRPLHGRLFAAGDDATPWAPLLVVSEGLWRRRFAADTAVIGKPVRINSRSFTLLGVVPDGLGYPFNAEAWQPLGFTPAQLVDRARRGGWLGLVGRVRDGTSVDAARAEVERVNSVVQSEFPENYRGRRVRAIAVHDFVVGEMRRPLLVVLAAVALVLLIACANVANLLLVRGARREGEMAVRAALGAGRGRLARQLLTESVILAVVGGAAGVALAVAGIRALLAMSPAFPRLDAVHVDPRVLAATAVVTIVTGLAFGALPALHAARADLTSALRGMGRTGQGRRTTDLTKRTIVVVQVALAVSLLSASGLLLRSFAQLTAVDPGFEPAQVQTMRLNLPGRNYDSPQQYRAFAEALEPRLQALPGVRAAAIANAVPLDDASFREPVAIRGAAPRDGIDQRADVRRVSPRYFDALAIALLRGRYLSTDDRASGAATAVVSEEFARLHFPNGDPLGHWIDGMEGGSAQIVGVVADVRALGLESAPEPTVYRPIAQAPVQNLLVVLATSVPPASVTAATRAAVREVDRELPLFDVQSMDERVASYLGARRFYATLLGLFASIALVVAAVGLFGVIAYSVSQRSHELGVRIALGATRGRVASMVVGEAMGLCTVGAVVGIGVSLGATRALEGMLYGVTATDLPTLAGALAVLATVALLASYLPARRASRVDPLIAMRGD
jgi:predicted permease